MHDEHKSLKTRQLSYLRKPLLLILFPDGTQSPTIIRRSSSYYHMDPYWIVGGNKTQKRNLALRSTCESSEEAAAE